jgi:hypothetical protein
MPKSYAVPARAFLKRCDFGWCNGSSAAKDVFPSRVLADQNWLNVAAGLIRLESNSRPKTNARSMSDKCSRQLTLSITLFSILEALCPLPRLSFWSSSLSQGMPTLLSRFRGQCFLLLCWVEACQHARLGAKHVVSLKSNIVQHRRVGSIRSEAFIPFR